MNDYFAAGVIAAILACFLVLAFVVLDDGGREYSDANTLEYEDYVQIDATDILGTSGPIEIVEIGEQSFIHATGTGKATIVYDDGSVSRYKIVPAVADLIIMDGQSNAAYHLPNASKAIAPDIGTSFYFGTPSSMPKADGEDVSGYSFYDFVGPEGLRVGDKGPELCRTWTEITGHKAIWVSLGIGGKRMSTWDQPNGTSWIQNGKVMDAANAALKDLPFDIKRTVVFWAQGESDYAHDTGYQNYIDRFKNLMDAAPDAWDRDIDKWYLIEGRTANVGWVNTAFGELAELDDVEIVVRASLIDSFTQDNGLMHTDDVHYTQLGDNAVANAAARHALGVQGNAPVYLVEQDVTATEGTAATVPTIAPAYTTDYGTLRLECSWSSTPDWTQTGTQTISGTPSDASRLLEGAPTVLVVTVEDGP